MFERIKLIVSNMYLVVSPTPVVTAPTYGKLQTLKIWVTSRQDKNRLKAQRKRKTRSFRRFCLYSVGGIIVSKHHSRVERITVTTYRKCAFYTNRRSSSPHFDKNQHGGKEKSDLNEPQSWKHHYFFLIYSDTQKAITQSTKFVSKYATFETKEVIRNWGNRHGVGTSERAPFFLLPYLQRSPE